MAGVKGKSGGARSGAGRKPAVQVSESTALVDPAQVLANVEKKLSEVRQRAYLEVAGKLDIGVEAFNSLKAVGLLPPSFYALDKQIEQTALQLQAAKSLPAPSTSLLLSLQRRIDSIS